jgi:carboxymethylenebutenolidase
VPTPKRRAKGAPSGPGAKAGKKVSETIRLKADDGFELSAYVAKPSGTPKGGFVVIQEIFGVNGHIRRITDGFARDGFLAIAPALFDRIEPGIELGYSPQDIERGLQLKSKSATENALQDIEAARTAVANAGSVGVIGYCWGGVLAWLSATRLQGFSAAVSYYGGGIGSVAEEQPNCPVLMHFGERDHAIPLADVNKVRAAHQQGVEIHVYPSGHGFNCDERESYDPDSARVARERTLRFLDAHLSPKSP